MYIPLCVQEIPYTRRNNRSSPSSLSLQWNFFVYRYLLNSIEFYTIFRCLVFPLVISVPLFSFPYLSFFFVQNTFDPLFLSLPLLQSKKKRKRKHVSLECPKTIAVFIFPFPLILTSSLHLFPSDTAICIL